MVKLSLLNERYRHYNVEAVETYHSKLALLVITLNKI